jgi:hypothetical protein
MTTRIYRIALALLWLAVTAGIAFLVARAARRAGPDTLDPYRYTMV